MGSILMGPMIMTVPGPVLAGATSSSGTPARASASSLKMSSPPRPWNRGFSPMSRSNSRNCPPLVLPPWPPRCKAGPHRTPYPLGIWPGPRWSVGDPGKILSPPVGAMILSLGNRAMTPWTPGPATMSWWGARVRISSPGERGKTPWSSGGMPPRPPGLT